MKEMDCVEVIVEKEKYAKDGIHKGMTGWICFPEEVKGVFLVDFPQYGKHASIATTCIAEEDLKYLPDGLDALKNERILREWGGDPETWKWRS